MRALIKTLFIVAVVALLPHGIHAQWPDYPSPGVPKTPDGKPNLEGPTPRTPDGKVDFTGLWAAGRGGGQRGRAAAAGPAAGDQAAARGAGGQAAAPQGAQAAAARGGAGGQANAPQGAQGGRGQRGAGAGAVGPDGIPIASFGNAGAGFPDGLPFQPWAKDLMTKRQADGSKDNPDALCLPMGFLQFHNHPEPRKMVQTPRLMVIMYEANHGLRQIFMDGRQLPKIEDIEPWYYGYSVGRWQGDTLVVETTGFTDLQWLDVRGSPLTSQAKVTERFRRPNFGSLEIEITVDDPKAYTKPWTTKVYQRIMLDTELIEFICEERDAKHYVGATPAAPAK
jgi:hypothetical protein